MTKINLEKNVYVYGRKYNLQYLRSLQPLTRGKDNEFVIYSLVEDQNELLLNTLEGFFISEIPLPLRKNYPFKREQKKLIQKKYQGKFIPFEQLK